MWPRSELTEGQPGLLNLQVNADVGGKANVADGSRLLFVVIVLPIAVPYPYHGKHSFSQTCSRSVLADRNRFAFEEFTVRSSTQESHDQHPHHDWCRESEQQQEQHADHHGYDQSTDTGAQKYRGLMFWF